MGFAEVCQLHLLAASPESTSAAIVSWFGRGRMSLSANDGWPWAADAPRPTMSIARHTSRRYVTEHPAMNSNPAARKSIRSSPTRLSLLDIAIARHARNHDSHESPLVGCYLCLIGAPRKVRGLRAAA